MMSCTVESTRHAQHKNIDVMHRYFDVGLFSSHLAFFSTFEIYLEFKCANPGLRVIFPFLVIKKKYIKLSSQIAKS